jgi:signal transduction histidine kinase
VEHVLGMSRLFLRYDFAGSTLIRLTRIQRSRLILASLLAVAFVPASALAYLQYRTLNEVQQQTRLTMNANLRQALLGARAEAVTDLFRWPDQALLGYEIHEYLRHGEKDQMRGVADTSRRICPYIGLFFSVRVRQGKQPELLLLRPGHAQRSMEYVHDSQAEGVMRQLAADIKITNSHTYRAYIDLDGERQQVFLHLVDDDGDEPKLPHINVIGYVGFAIPTTTLAKDYFSPLLKKHLARLASSGSDGFNNQAQGAIFDGDGAELGASEPGVKGPFSVEERLGKRKDLLPGWTFRAALAKGTVVGFDQTHFARGVSTVAMITGLLLAALVTIGMTTARELEFSRTKTEFVASMSHEFKTPLSIIRGFVETLHLNRLRDANQREEYFRIIETEIQRLSSMIDRVLEISKIDAGLKRYEPEFVNVSELIEETLTKFSHELEKKAFVLERQIESPLPEARVDPIAFSQALLNLLTNAVKYSGAERKITVRAARRQNRLEISVTDCGIGISKQEQLRIFDRFYRAGQSAAKTAGAGLGLALVKHFADAHGGEVSVTSSPGKGSMFAIFLPLAS